MNDIKTRVQAVFREVFENPALVITDETSAADIEGWDSLAHINLIIAVEKEFRIRFATSEISRMKDEDQNVGAFLRLIESKAAKLTS